MSNISIPSTAKQVYAQKVLNSYKGTVLGDALKKAVSNIPPLVIHSEIAEYVPSKSMKILQICKIREETVFALPCILRENPKLLGYYRLLMGISEKQFYTSASGLLPYRSMEHAGSLRSRRKLDIDSLCRAINDAMSIFIENAQKESLEDDLNDLPLMTLGVYVDGAWRNIIGQQAASHVFSVIRVIVNAACVNIISSDEKSFTFSNKRSEIFKVVMSSDPDISVLKLGSAVSKKLCIEIKGGQDIANVHNRAGEAEKSHQKATLEGWEEKWTIIYLEGLQDDQKNKLPMESPSTDYWFDINEVCAQSGTSYELLKKLLLDRFALT